MHHAITCMYLLADRYKCKKAADCTSTYYITSLLHIISHFIIYRAHIDSYFNYNNNTNNNIDNDNE